MSKTGALPAKGHTILSHHDETDTVSAHFSRSFEKAFAGLFSSRLTWEPREKFVEVKKEDKAVRLYHQAKRRDHEGEFESLYRGKAGFVGFDKEAKLNDHDDQFLQLLVDKNSLKEELRTIVCAMSCRDAVKATVEYIRLEQQHRRGVLVGSHPV